MHQPGRELRTNNEESNSIAMTKGGRNYLPPLAGNRYTADKKVRRHFWLWILVSQKCETNDAPVGIVSLLAGNEKSPLTDAAGKRRTQR